MQTATSESGKIRRTNPRSYPPGEGSIGAAQVVNIRHLVPTVLMTFSPEPMRYSEALKAFKYHLEMKSTGNEVHIFKAD